MGAQAGVLQGERRWGAAGAGLPRPGASAGSSSASALILFWPDRVRRHGSASPSAAGCRSSSAALALRRPRDRRAAQRGAPGPRPASARSGHSSQALLAFFALSNADILVARATMSNSEAGLYAARADHGQGGPVPAAVRGGLRVPVDVQGGDQPAHPAAGAWALSAALGAVARARRRWCCRTSRCSSSAATTSTAIEDDLWKFAIVGTLLSMIQLLVYSALARRQGRAVIMIWTALAVLVASRSRSTRPTSLVLVVVTIDGAAVPGAARRSR